MSIQCLVLDPSPNHPCSIYTPPPYLHKKSTLERGGRRRQIDAGEEPRRREEVPKLPPKAGEAKSGGIYILVRWSEAEEEDPRRSLATSSPESSMWPDLSPEPERRRKPYQFIFCRFRSRFPATFPATSGRPIPFHDPRSEACTVLFVPRPSPDSVDSCHCRKIATKYLPEKEVSLHISSNISADQGHHRPLRDVQSETLTDS